MAKRLITLIVTFGLVAIAPAGAQTGRTEEREYTRIDTTGTSGTVTSGDLTFKTRKADRFVSVEVVDDTGQPIAFDVEQRNDGEIQVDGCGTTPAPVPIKGGRDVEISLLIQFDPDETCMPSVPTHGFVTVTFTR